MENRQYFAKDNDLLKSDPKIITAKIGNLSLKFKTDIGVFSRNFLDYATKLLLEKMDFSQVNGAILDIGCGYGPVGIYANLLTKKEVVMIDVNRRALELAKENLHLNNACGKVIESDSLDAILDQKFSMAILNPPIHAGKIVIYKMFEQAYQVLDDFGEFWIVIQQKHGAPSAKAKLENIFEKVEIVYKKSGFYIIKCKKIS